MRSQPDTSSPVQDAVAAATRSGRDIPRSSHEAATVRPSYERILDAFARHGAMTPDEVAEKLGRSIFYIRPRCSELRALGLLRATCETRANPTSGLPASVLSL